MAETYKNVVMEAAKGIAEGIPPTNMQIEETLDTAKRVIEERQQCTLDPRTNIIAQDLKAILNDTERLIEEKNRDEKMQRFLLEAKMAAEDLASENLGRQVQSELKQAGKSLRPLQDDALEILQMIKNVVFEIMRSSSFRKSLINAIDLFEEVFWDELREKGSKLSEGVKMDIAEGDTSMKGTRQAAQQVGKEAQKGETSSSMDVELRKRELKRRFNDVLREISENPEYNQAVSDLFKLTGRMRSRLQKAGKRLKGAAKQAENVHITNMWELGTQIIEEFTGHDRIKHIIDALDDLLDFIKEDARANKFFDDLKGYINDALENPQKIGLEDAEKAFDTLYDEGRELFKSQDLKKYVNALGDELRGMIKTARRDPASERLLNSTRALIRDLTMDTTTGKPSLWTLRDNLERSGRSLLLPVLLRELEIVPVRGVRGSNATYDYVIRNLAFSAYDLLPERARFYMDLDVDIDLRDLKRSRWSGEEIGETESDVNGEIVLRLDGIKTHVRDVEFHYIRKTFPQLEDWGRLDIDTSGRGTRIEVRWRIISQRGAAPTVMGYRVYCGIDGLDVTIREAARHELIDRIMSKIFAGTLKERTEREIERALAGFASRISLVFNDVFAGRVPAILPSSMSAALPVLTL